MNIDSILIPTDFSDGSQLALQSAVTLAKQLEASLMVLHVVEKLPFYPYTYVGEVAADEREYHDRSLRHAKEELHKAAESLEGSEVSFDTLIQIGYPAEEILSCADSHDAQLIVMSTHGRSGFSHALLGSIVEKVIRTATVPVIALKSPDRNQAPPRFGKILYPCDLSENSMAGFEVAQLLAQSFDGRIDFFTVMTDPALDPLVNWDLAAPESYQHVAETKITEALRALVDHRSPSVPVDFLAVRGRPFQQITAQAEKEDYDLIVMTTHGRSGWRRALLGSVTEKVVRVADRGVLAVPVSSKQEE